MHPLFSAIEDLNFDDGNYEFKRQTIAHIIERIYHLPIMKVMFLDEIITGMTDSSLDENGLCLGVFEHDMTEVFNRAGLSDLKPSGEASSSENTSALTP